MSPMEYDICFDIAVKTAKPLDWMWERCILETETKVSSIPCTRCTLASISDTNQNFEDMTVENLCYYFQGQCYFKANP